MAKRKRRTKAEIEASKQQKHEPKGLGDTIENVLEVTKVAKVAKWLLGEDCGCDKRKEALNKLWQYRRKPNCLTEDEHEFLTYFFDTVKNTVTITHQQKLLTIYNRVFNTKETMSSCSQCWKDRINELKKVYNTYEEAN